MSDVFVHHFLGISNLFESCIFSVVLSLFGHFTSLCACFVLYVGHLHLFVSHLGYFTYFL